MKKVTKLSYILFLVFSINSCISRDIIDKKEGIFLPSVENLRSIIQNDKDVHLQWDIPLNIPSEIQRPLSVYVQVYRGTTLEYQISLSDEPTTWNYVLAEPDNEYRIIVKMQGWLKEKVYGKSDEIYSLGQTVNVN
ncbi:MAG: DUF4945 domain-containing protein [Bacteroidales bacterium]|jgi:hypothetical protein|nr:DUF4945 domain-containing protein [Bacteroidales bacterium]